MVLRFLAFLFTFVVYTIPTFSVTIINNTSQPLLVEPTEYHTVYPRPFPSNRSNREKIPLQYEFSPTVQDLEPFSINPGTRASKPQLKSFRLNVEDQTTKLFRFVSTFNDLDDHFGIMINELAQGAFFFREFDKRDFEPNKVTISNRSSRIVMLSRYYNDPIKEDVEMEIAPGAQESNIDIDSCNIYVKALLKNAFVRVYTLSTIDYHIGLQIDEKDDKSIKVTEFSIDPNA